MKSSFLFIRFCVLVSILASGTLVFFLLRAIYYPQLSILLLLVILLCHLVTTDYKKSHTQKESCPASSKQLSIPADAKKALAVALGSVASLLSNEKTKLTASEKKLIMSEREALLTIAHFFESIETLRTNTASSLEHPREITSLRETIVSIVETRRTSFLKKGIVLLYRSSELTNEYIAIDQKHLRRIIETLLRTIAERDIHGRVTLSQHESTSARTISVTIKLGMKRATEQSDHKQSALLDAQYTTLQHMLERYGGTISFNSTRVSEWTSCTCTFPSHI